MTKGQVLTTLSPLGSSIDLDDNNEIQVWDRAKMIHKISKYGSQAPIGLDTNLLLSGSGINISGADLETGTILKTYDIPDLAEASASGDPQQYKYNWSGSSALAVASGSIVDTVLESIVTIPQAVAGIEMTLDGGQKIHLALNSTLYVQEGDTDKTEFLYLEDYILKDGSDITGYKVMLYNNNTSTLSPVGITGVQYYWAQNGGFTLNVEETDTYFIEDGSDSNTFVILHNACSMWDFYGSAFCDACGMNTGTYFPTSGATVCCSNTPSNAYYNGSPSCSSGK